MIAWIDAYLIPLLLVVPALAVFFLAIMPSSDRIALRHAGMGASIVTGLCALRVAWRVVARDEVINFSFTPPGLDEPLVLSATRLAAPSLVALAFIFPMALRAGAPRIIERTQGYVVLMLGAELLSLASLLAGDAIWRVALMSFSSIPVLFLVALFGGTLRGTVTMRVSMVMLVVDTLALTALAFSSERLEPPSWIGLLVLASCALRLGVIPLSAPFMSCLRQAPVAAAALVVGVWTVTGANVFTHMPALSPRAHVVVVIVAVSSAILGALMAASDRDLRRVAASIAIAHGSIAAVALLSGDPRARAAAMVYVPIAGLSVAFLLFTVDALERRYLSRDLTELVGTSHHLPALWRIFFASLAGALGAPLVGAGVLLVPMSADLLRGYATTDAALAWFVLIGLALVIAAWGGAAAVVLRHLSAPPLNFDAIPPSRLTSGQAARLWFPGVVILAAVMFALPVTQRLGDSEVAADEVVP